MELEAKMANEAGFEAKPEEARPEEATQRRRYTPPAVADFFQPLVLLGSTGVINIDCGSAHPKPPKR